MFINQQTNEKNRQNEIKFNIFFPQVIIARLATRMISRSQLDVC